MKRFLFLLSIILFISCGNSKNSPEFMEATEGRYLFNSDETIEVFFEENVMKIKWRNQEMEPIKASDSAFYLKEMNEKLVFVNKPEMHIILAPKTEHDGVIYKFNKLKKGEKTPSEYFDNGQYDKALAGYLAIKEKDSTDKSIRQYSLNSLGYQFLRNKDFEKAEQIFKINIALYPYKSNVYDSMGDVFRAQKDTVKAIEYYQRSLKINPENRAAKRNLQSLQKK